jgi:hypothetical protein
MDETDRKHFVEVLLEAGKVQIDLDHQGMQVTRCEVLTYLLWRRDPKTGQKSHRKRA